MKVKWKPNVTCPVRASVVYREMEKLEKKNRGVLLPEMLVQAARKKSSPIHDCFEWDERKAAAGYRREQARQLIKGVVVVYETEEETINEVRAFVSILPENGRGKDRYYTRTARVVKSKPLSDNVRAQILAELLAVKKKYEQFQDGNLQRIWKAVEMFAKASR